MHAILQDTLDIHFQFTVSGDFHHSYLQISTMYLPAPSSLLFFSWLQFSS